ncbi:hypothetical protein [Halobacillus litoralis]|uniref:Uncharacterized protein n=1 Tax=Halobacillus litoralis TaxID=45668 RepID=A0A410M9S1_9BACI|nr:hypothetical protein [Halobacillus litoralis]QAS51418.1 hypothetical protein HLI_03880 [Halobacillus litoralis]
MFVGRTLFLLGMAFVFFSTVIMITIPFSNSGGGFVTPLFALLNGLLAMGVGELVIDANHRKSLEKSS